MIDKTAGIGEKNSKEKLYECLKTINIAQGSFSYTTAKKHSAQDHFEIHFLISVITHQTAMSGQKLIHQNEENHGTVLLGDYSFNTNLYLFTYQKLLFTP